MNNSEQMNSEGRGEFLFYSFGGFDFLENYLCTLYGKQRGSYLNNIQRYYNGEEFKDMRRKEGYYRRGEKTYGIEIPNNA